ncbi:hypothetical protein [Verrucosispora sp. ts21]|uniref:hypothetical protein n=1 Tax=Verrucosispora sp. ts21 TaxID=2069341 RepID=UPI0018EBEF52|nr:hypothetical protein [Verrucosispora sp. ts21]
MPGFQWVPRSNSALPWRRFVHVTEVGAVHLPDRAGGGAGGAAAGAAAATTMLRTDGGGGRDAAEVTYALRWRIGRAGSGCWR